MKYNIKVKFEIEGKVDKPDIIGAIFGQTENLFGEDFDLRELQDKGRIGRIIVETREQQSHNKTIGEMVVPSNLDRVETSLIAAMIENVDKVGPYNAKFQLVEIEDIREEKLKKIKERAVDILSNWKSKTIDIREVINDISNAVKTGEITEWGPDRLPAGPDVEKDPNLIIVEGRADIINLLRYGYKNTVAVGGATGKIPKSLVKLSKQKKMVIAFTDGDRGGEMILRELIDADVKVDYVARAPTGREVEELTGKEISKSLANAIPLAAYIKKIETEKREAEVIQAQVVAQAIPKVETHTVVELVRLPQPVIEEIKKLPGTLEGIFYNDAWEPIEKLQVREIISKLESYQDSKVAYIIFDGVVTQRLVDLAVMKNVRLIIGARVGGIAEKPSQLELLSFTDIFS
ncbi:DNA primase [Sulfolobales archaeon HS-7]|nr:DNA primase [Sulfolobales archaeon HS-7]